MKEIIDISQKIHAGMFVYPGDPAFSSRSVSSFKQGDICEVSELTIGSHCGTHIDAPLHMIHGGEPLERLPLSAFVGPCRVLTLPVTVVNERMLIDAGISEGERILLRTDPQAKAQQQDGFNPTALSIRAAEYLAKQKVCLVGIDSPSVENMELCNGEVHRILMKAGIAILEGLDLQKAHEEKYTLCALPLSLQGENGSPCRAILIRE